VVNILVPPLRERKEDLPLLITAFRKEFSGENNKAIEGIDNKARSCLYAYSWPGNVRELRNCMESAVVMSRGSYITEDDLPPGVRDCSDRGWIRIPLGVTMEEAEKIIIRETLSAQKGNQSKAADILGIGRKTIHRKLPEWQEGAAGDQ
jgi:DNA-binding NtrC family response regulator